MIGALSLSRLYFLASVRRKVHIATLLVALVLLALPSYVNEFSLGINAFERVSKDFGLTLIGMFGVGMAILLGSTSVPGDVEHRSVYPILARPLPRGGYLAAHILAMAGMLGASLLFLGAALSFSLGIKSGHFDLSVMTAVYGSLLQAMVVAAVCMACSVVSSPALAGTVGAAIFLLGNLSGAFIKFFLVEDRQSAISASLAKALKTSIPNLSVFDIKDPMVHHLDLPAGYLWSITYYAVIWVLLMLALARAIFWSRDL